MLLVQNNEANSAHLFRELSLRQTELVFETKGHVLMLIVTTKFNINLTVFVHESYTFKIPVIIIMSKFLLFFF